MRLRRVFALLLTLAVLVPNSMAFAMEPRVVSDAGQAAIQDAAPRWIVRMQGAPLSVARRMLLETRLSSITLGGLRLNSDVSLSAYRAKLEQQQQGLFQMISVAMPGAELHRTYQTIFNGIAVKLPKNDAAAIARLRNLPGVISIAPDQRYELQNFDSGDLIGAPAFWENPSVGGAGNAGAGVKIAIIDSGIRLDNPFFNPSGYSYPPGYPKGDTAFTTPKVIAARAYFRPDVPPLEGSGTPQPGPEDAGHGSHVAGIAAGNANTQVTVDGLPFTISGVAPHAWLMNYKAFYTNEHGSGSAFSIELLGALNDAVADGANVINASWGGRATESPYTDPLTVASEAAVAAGVTVVFSAGNEGPDQSTAGSPGFGDSLISVGATTTDKTFSHGALDVTAPEGVPAALQGNAIQPALFGPELTSTGPVEGPYLPVVQIDGAGHACADLPGGSLNGRIAVIERGTCPFIVKVLHAQYAGAAAVVVYNSAEGGDDLIIMGSDDEEMAAQVNIPAVFIAHANGAALVDWYTQHADSAKLRLDPSVRVVARTADVLAPFSARGPTFHQTLKPDVMAPGVNILSAGVGEGEGTDSLVGFGFLSGTSMAAPHVTGAVALLKQLHPDWSPGAIKAALMTTANAQVWRDDAKTQTAGALERGAGRIDVNAASNPGLIFDRGSLSYGLLKPSSGAPTRSEIVLMARNVTGKALHYTIGAHSLGGNFTITANPSEVNVAAGQTAEIRVAIEIPADTNPADYDGIVELSGGPQPLHLPVWARTLPAQFSTAKVLLIDNDASSSFGAPDYAGYYGNALGTLGISFNYLDVDALAGQAQTLPSIGELQQYEIILWFTGDNFLANGEIPLNPVDQDIMIAYLQSGGNLIATGQDLADASDIDPSNDPRYGRSDLYLGYLGVRFDKDNAFADRKEKDQRRIIGTGETPWLNGVTLDLSLPKKKGQVGDATSAANQYSVDTLGFIDADPRVPEDYSRVALRVQQSNGQPGGIVGVVRSSEPTLENPRPAIPYRTSFLSFGLEGVRNDTGTTKRYELLQNLLYWHVGHPTVSVDMPTVTTTEANQSITLTASPSSNVPASFVHFRWSFGDGTGAENDQPQISHVYAQPGTYTVRMEATDNWGHNALSGR